MKIQSFLLLFALLMPLSACTTEEDDQWFCDFYGNCKGETSAQCATWDKCKKEDKSAECSVWGNCDKPDTAACSLWGNCN